MVAPLEHVCPSLRLEHACPSLRLEQAFHVPAPAVVGSVKAAIRYLSLHTGLPALLVAAVLVAVGYRVLERSARFAVEVAVITAALVAATELGWLRW